MRKMPYADWMVAQNELERIRHHIDEIGLPQLTPMMEQVYYFP